LRELVKPDKIEVETQIPTFGRFIIKPLERGYGVTLGNSLRRVLLSSLPGAAVTAVKIEGVPHEFSTIPGVKEEALEIMLNLKKLRIKLHGEGEKILKLSAKGPGEVFASHFEKNPEVEIVNPQLKLATLDSEKAKLEMEVRVARGRGYVEASENKKSDWPIGVIPIDSIFSPVRKVNFRVEPTRIGRKTSYDSLTLEIETDGTITPQEALKKAAEILSEYLSIFLKEERKEEEKKEEGLTLSLEEIGIKGAPLKALKAEGIEKVEDLISRSPEELLKIKGFKEKSLETVKEILKNHGLKLKEKK